MLYCGFNKIQILNSVLWLFFYSQCFHSLPHLFCITDPACSLSFMFCVPIINNRGKSETFPHSLKKREREGITGPFAASTETLTRMTTLSLHVQTFWNVRNFFFFLPVKGTTYVRRQTGLFFMLHSYLF